MADNVAGIKFIEIQDPTNRRFLYPENDTEFRIYGALGKDAIIKYEKNGEIIQEAIEVFNARCNLKADTSQLSTTAKEVKTGSQNIFKKLSNLFRKVK